MADFGTALTVAQKLYAALDCSLVEEAYAVSKYESELERLKTTVATVQSVLIDAGKKVKLSETDLNYIQKLKDAVYDADDLFDKFITIAARKQNGSFSDKVRYFFSSENPIKVAHEIFRDVKKIRSHLDAIADDRTKFGFSVDTQPLRRRREETCSYLYANNVIGRDGDAAEIMHRLLDSAEDIGFLTIVGIGGLGKTTLAKLVFSDKRIESNFPVRLWVCVADQEGAPFDPKVILSKMLELVGCQVASNASIEKVQTEYQSKIGGKKLFLVLDDIWTEKKLEWLRFKEFLMSSGPGSRIIVTTRSMETARIIGNGVSTNTYVLQGLSDKDSWCLFEMSAFEKGSKHPMFVEIGKKIVQKCHNLPLAINVIGSLLYGLPCDKWQAFETNGFDGVFSGDNEVMSILRFSYDQLEPSLKSCFTYCAIFPKDFVIDKEMLLNIWEAQGYLVPFDNCHSIENVGEEHFSVLLKRCFFQDINKNEYGEVESFKIHDFMHDLAQNVSESECFSKNSRMAGLKSSARHIFETESGIDETNYMIKSTVRSYFQSYPRYVNILTSISMGKMIENWICLRVLSSKLYMSSLPNSMVNLIHLRYLNLSDSLIEKLPNSIVKLHNLLTLNLNNCKELKKLPKKFSKLVNLSHLYLDGSGLKYMPVGISKLSGLRVLTKFVIKDESVSGRQHVGQLNDLKAIAMNLKGRIHILFSEQLTSAEGYDWEESCLKRAEHLKELRIDFSDEEMEWVTQETIMKMLWPHPKLKKFELDYYNGETIKCRGSAHDNWSTILPNLVVIELHKCSRLQQLPLLSDLQHLKHLTLDSLSTLEYMEEVSSRSSECKLTFFPSLESLNITKCYKLKGWWRDDNASTHSHPAFPRLSGLVIGDCNELTSFPPCPRLHTLELLRNNRALRIIITDEGQSSSSSILSCYNEKPGSNHDSGNTNAVVVFKVDHIPHLKPDFQLLTELHINCNNEMESLSEAEEMFQNCCVLKKLEIVECSKLTSLCGGLEHLSALHSLILKDCDALMLEEGDHDDCSGMPWRALHSNLCSLKLIDLPKVEKLPMGMKYLTSLQHLDIGKCENLKAIPEWVGCFRSLQSLFIALQEKELKLEEGERDNGNGMPWRALHSNLCSLKLIDLPKVEKLPMGMKYLTSLQHLDIGKCENLKAIPEWVGCFRSLQSLFIESCEELKLEEGERDNGNGMPWRALHSNLCSLKLIDLPKVEKLPMGMKYLTSLQHLDIGKCENLKAIPEWVGCFRSLQSLFIESCEELKLEEGERDNGNGMPWRALHSNLCSLKLIDLPKVEKLPMGMKYLTSLQHLDIGKCENLKAIPEWVGCFRSLQSLFIESCEELKLEEGERDNGNGMPWRALHSNLCSLKLIDLPKVEKLPMGMKYLTSLQHLDIGKCENLKAIPEWVGCFRSLQSLFIESCEELKLEEGERDNGNGMPWRALHSNLCSLKLIDLPKVEKLPMGMKYLTSLQHLDIGKCENLKAIPEWVGCFRSLQSLFIESCEELKLEEGERDNGNGMPWRALHSNLCSLKLIDLPKVEKLPMGMKYLTSLQHLDIGKCENLKAIPEWVGCFRSLQSLFIESCEELKLEEGERDNGNGMPWRALHSNLCSLKLIDLPKVEKLPMGMKYLTSLQHLDIGKCENLKAIPEWVGCFRSLQSLFIESCEELKLEEGERDNGNGMPWRALHSNLCSLKLIDLPKVEKLPMGMKYLTSLQHLDIGKCENLKAIPEWVGCFRSLQSLFIESCEELKLEEGERDNSNGMPWRALHSSLRYLALKDLPKVEKLPMGMKYLTSLQHLQIHDCHNLKEIPEWVGCLQSLQSLDIMNSDAITSLPDAMLKLTSLQQLNITFCWGLRKRCSKPNGQDWPKIKHIPQTRILPNFSYSIL